MIFNTWTFFVFALVAFVIYWAVVPRRWKPYYLIVSGCAFYAFSVPAYLGLIVALGAATYTTGRAMLANANSPRLRRMLMVLGVGLITLILVIFKYTKFFEATLSQVSSYHIVPIPNIVVPLAISFFTFEFVHVLVDVYRGKITKLKPVDFAVFTMFFPTLVAGPIKRYQAFAPQVQNITMPSSETFTLNFYRIAIGLAKKIIVADSMSVLTGPLTAPGIHPYARLDYVVAILAYTVKIYFDFSAYSDIAIGLAGLLGIQIPENFDRPYRARNVSAFWRRWHMSLSAWVRDYIFIPLGGSRRLPLITAMNLLLAMAIAGLWHGAAWTFVAWGVWHGLGLAAHRAWSVSVAPRFACLAEDSRPVYLVSITMTFVFVMLGWVLFAATSFGNAATVIVKAFGP